MSLAEDDRIRSFDADRRTRREGGTGEPRAAAGSRWDCVAIDPNRIRVDAICGREELAGLGLHWFQVFFETGAGLCFITTGEALHLRQLNTDWVKRALLNLATRYGSGWLEDALVSSPGLLLHHFDAHEP